MMNIKIIVATHKKYKMPNDEIYLPIHVGAEGKESLGYIGDNTGNNISSKNANYCELTGLYWAWKNLEADYIGLVHYRRYFGKKENDLYSGILTYENISSYLDKIKIFVPKKRKYYIESLYSHYAHTHYAEHLDIVKEIIIEKYPDYLKEYDKVMKQKWGYMFNMMIMEKSILNEYCKWLFDILFELENRTDSDNLSKFQGRFYGRVSEIIFNVWLEHWINNQKISKTQIKELPYFHMEKINWVKKGLSFILSKFIGRKYKESF